MFGENVMFTMYDFKMVPSYQAHMVLASAPCVVSYVLLLYPAIQVLHVSTLASVYVVFFLLSMLVATVLTRHVLI